MYEISLSHDKIYQCIYLLKKQKKFITISINFFVCWISEDAKLWRCTRYSVSIDGKKSAFIRTLTFTTSIYNDFMNYERKGIHYMDYTLYWSICLTVCVFYFTFYFFKFSSIFFFYQQKIKINNLFMLRWTHLITTTCNL